MKTNLLFILCYLSTTFAFAQFGDQQIITTIAEAARAVYSVDLDGDGDLDVLSASFSSGGKVAWYENLDGLGNFGEQQIIAVLKGTRHLFSTDLDGDGDMDVLASSFDGTTPGVYWMKNLDGLGNFGTPLAITIDVIGPIGVHAADLDNDGDMDVLSSSMSDNKVAWYENLDGLGTFGEQHILTTNALSARTVYAADLNGDGNMDVISASTAGDTVIWFKNEGFGNFNTEQIISNTVDGVDSIYAEDMDGDGDMDVLSASYINKISWHENIDGLGTFNNEHIISELTNGASSVHAEDMDNDGDMDVLSASAIDNKIAWYENIDGQGTFGEQLLIDQENIIQGRDVFAADLDGDGDMDVLAASQNNQTIAWYENLTILGMEDVTANELVFYPNPVKNTLQISSYDLVITNIEIYTVFGKRIFNKKGDNTQIDLSNLSSGLYLVKIKTENGVLVKKIIKD